MPARLGKAWPPRGGNGRVMIYLAFGLENDFLRYRIAVVLPLQGSLQGTETATRERESGALRGRVPAESSAEPWQELVARDHFISRGDGTANLTECPTRRGFIALN